MPFSTLSLHADLVKNLSTLGYEHMTAIQEQSLPPILNGKDVIAQGKTGSGKTAAFGLGLLNKLDVKKFRIQTLVLCPTRELADQVATEIRKLARSIHNIKVLTICGGMPFSKQLDSLRHGAHIIVGTPGRIEDHLNRGTLDLNNVETLVLDEADRMLEMGFQDSLDAIIDQTPSNRQTLLFSATFPDQIQRIAQSIMQEPEIIKVAGGHDHSSITQHFYQADSADDRLHAVRLLLLQHEPDSCVIFCNTKAETVEVTEELNAYGFHAKALNGDLEQRDRDQTLVLFANKSISILVATDVAARGLDIESLAAVINYNLAHDTETHTHRIGRTGRAGSKGLACTLFSHKDDYKITLLEEAIGRDINAESLPRESVLNKQPLPPATTTFQIDSGKKQKIRPGDIIGALTSEGGIAGNQVGKIKVYDTWAFVAVERKVAKNALNKLSKDKMKGRQRRVRQLR